LDKLAGVPESIALALPKWVILCQPSPSFGAPKVNTQVLGLFLENGLALFF